MRVLLCVAISAALVACPTVEGPSEGDSGGSSATDGGARDRATGTDRGGGFDVTGFDIMSIDIAGIDIAAYDLGIIEYTGVAEEGVVCGDATCAADIVCCAGMTTLCDDGDGICDGIAVAVICDGAEDCESGEACCVDENYSFSCMAEADCASSGTRICVDSSECGDNGVCCSATALQSLGLDVGWCEVDHCGN